MLRKVSAVESIGSLKHNFSLFFSAHSTEIEKFQLELYVQGLRLGRCLSPTILSHLFRI
jgi:hypothetical protein